MTEKHNKISVFRGIGTALMTPFRNGEVDLPAFVRLIETQIEAGVGALIVAGTTGEASTLSVEERNRLTRAARETAGGRVPVIVGSGANDTQRAILLSEEAEKNGADALLVVTPYYNKGNEEGLYRHYAGIAERVSLPILLYNVPGRTGVDLSLALYERLAAIPHIAGVKEAKSEIERVAELCTRFEDRLAIYAGNDLHFLPALAYGADGVISVTSNLFPTEYVAMYRDFMAGKVFAAGAAARRLLPLSRLLFAETSPVPLKAAAALCGMAEEELRLPLSPAAETTREALRRELCRLGRL